MPRQPARLKSAPPEGSAAPGRFFMRPAVGVRGSFAVRGSWIAGIVFYLLFSPARFKSGRPHHTKEASRLTHGKSDIMKIFLAGNIAKKIPKEFIVYKAPYVLQTFFDAQNWDDQLCKTAIESPKMFFLDSGAFSLMNHAKGAKDIDLEQYVERYIEFINRYQVKYFFELDLDTIIGIKETLKITQKLERETGKQCIPVYHACRGIETWQVMIKQYKYVAIGASGLTDECKWVRDKEAVCRLIDMAHEKNCQVHGLGYTRLSNINNTQVNFDSVDSSSCLSGGRYATMYTFTGNSLISQSIKGKSPGYKILNDHNIRQWIKMCNYKDGLL